MTAHRAAPAAAAVAMHAMLVWFVLFVTFGLAACASKPPRNPADQTAAEIARYRFGLDQECRAVGRLRGETAASIEPFCACVYETLGRNASDDDWRHLVQFNEEGRSEDERRALAPLMVGIGACRAAPPAPAATASAAALLLGRWAWTRPFDGCMEAFEFRDNGTVRIERGNERTENTYAVAAAPEPSGRVAVRLAVTRVDAGATCEGKLRDDKERGAPLFLLLGSKNEALAVCESADGADCAGPLQRQRDPH